MVEEQNRDLSAHFTVAEKDGFFLRQLLAGGQLANGERFEVSSNLKGGELLVCYKGRYTFIPMQSYVIAAANAIERVLEDEKRTDTENS